MKSSFENASVEYSTQDWEKETQRIAIPEVNEELKEFRLNLADEYVSHLEHMAQLNNFKELKFAMDHAFFKSIVVPRIEDK